MDTAVEEELQCPVCLELFTQPTVLPCSHVLCRRPCAERLFEDDFVRCPVCRDRSFVTGGVESLPKVLSLENIIERYRNQGNVISTGGEGTEECGPEDIPCQLCEESPRKAKKSCLDCNASYCQSCLRFSHPYREPFSRHQLVEPRRYPKPIQLRCEQHDMRVNVYCSDCRQLACVLCSDDKDGHQGHRVQGLTHAAELLRKSLEATLPKLEKGREAYSEQSSSLQEKMAKLEAKVTETKEIINQQCDNLAREIELKREFFLFDVDHEKNLKVDKISRQMSEYTNHCVNLQNLQHFAQETLKEEDTCAFIQYAQKACDSIRESLELSADLLTVPIDIGQTQKVVDLRRERALLRGVEYLSVPAKPEIAVTKCSKSENHVVLVLSPPKIDHDIIDGYQIYYCSEEMKRVGDQQAVMFRTNQGGRWSFKQQSEPYTVCIIEKGLLPKSPYFFCIQAINEAGASDISEILPCQTLHENSEGFEVRDINIQLCRTFTFSIQIHCESPTLQPPTSGTAHFLLHRESKQDNLWRSFKMYARNNHSVFGLEADMSYDFRVLACRKDGESSLSAQVTLKTERDS